MTRHTIINIQQIRDDICKRKAMPPFSPDTSINRLKTLSDTERSFTPEVVESLLGEIDVLSKSEWTLADELVKAQKRIAELERCETQLIDERDNAESALNDAYKAVMGQAPEWSNWFSFADAIDEIEVACGLWRNQAEDVLQFRARIVELEAMREVFLRAKALMYQSGGAPIENSLNPIDAWLYDAERAAPPAPAELNRG
ncbi:hypothetical protein [Citrobacter freundii]|uniref:hypothetical protein n=1 Tax=Citrobacter freundii TaxID=546 RepID=UPI002F96947C